MNYKHLPIQPVPTKLFPFAIFAMVATPNCIELGDGTFYNIGIVGEDTCLEVTAAGAFHTNTSSR
jgi:hypothetical protein